MKHAYSFVAGAVLISGFVVSTNAQPGWMFLLGSLVTLASLAVLARLIGRARIIRFLSYTDLRGVEEWHLRKPHKLQSAGSNPVPATTPSSFRLAPPWNSGAKGVSANTYDVPVWNGSSGRDKRIFDNRISATENRRVRNVPALRPKAQSARRSHPVSVLKTQKSANVKVVQSSVLPRVQQDVLSALTNLKVPFADAEQAVREAGTEHSGESFDELFRASLNLLRAGKRRVA